jgi:hypothetical protein
VNQLPPVSVAMEAQAIDGEAQSVITLRNQSDQPVLIGGCGVWIERESATGWATAYSPSCTEGLIALEPGTSQIREYPELAGATYRAVAAYRLTPSGPVRYEYGNIVDW